MTKQEADVILAKPEYERTQKELKALEKYQESLKTADGDVYTIPNYEVKGEKPTEVGGAIELKDWDMDLVRVGNKTGKPYTKANHPDVEDSKLVMVGHIKSLPIEDQRRFFPEAEGDKTGTVQNRIVSFGRTANGKLYFGSAN